MVFTALSGILISSQFLYPWEIGLGKKRPEMKGQVKINPVHKSCYQTFNLQLRNGDLLNGHFFDEFSIFMTCIKSTAPGKGYGSQNFKFRDI